MGTWSNFSQGSVNVYDVDATKIIDPGDELVIIYKDVSDTPLTKISDTPYYSPIIKSQIGLSFSGAGVSEEIDIIVNPSGSTYVHFLVIEHISVGSLTIYFNDMSTPPMVINSGERRLLPVNEFITKFFLVSSTNLTCDVLQIHNDTFLAWTS